MAFIDLTGQVFGKLTVMSRAPDRILPSGYKTVMWNCHCLCGNDTIVSGKNLKHNKYPTRSCGCAMHEIRNDLTGKRFGRLLVVERTEGKLLKSGYKQQMYKCLCDCENTIVVTYISLVTGNTTSCGCYAKELLRKKNTTHGMSGTKLYDVWKEMRRRCSKENDGSYFYYGARGIKVCDEWESDFQSFYNWAIKNGYREGLEIDRINNNDNYEPSNCRWVTRRKQMNNCSINIVIPIKGYCKTIAEWASLFDIHPETLRNRFGRGWDEITALTAPKNYKYYKKGKYIDGEKLFSDIIRC